MSASSAPTGIDAADAGHMATALGLARRALGRAWPNPAVGCVLVASRTQVVGRGWTQIGGRPHAEAEALARAGEAARGATAYVTLEPCAHQGVTPPCADALLAAGIGRAVIAVEDPDPRVQGRGVDRLRAAGTEVRMGIGRAEAEEINAGFFLKVRTGRPLVTLKLATSLDGRIALRTGESRWITGEAARRRGHWLRAIHDAVLVGSGTALADDPLLTCRLEGLEGRSPVRVLLDPRLKVPPRAQLYRNARDVPVWLVVGDRATATSVAEREALGAEPIRVSEDDTGRVPIAEVLAALAGRGITRLLVEGGSRLAAVLLGAGLVDRLAWFRAPLVLGGDGLAAADALGLARLADAPRFRRVDVETVGDDILETYAREG